PALAVDGGGRHRFRKARRQHGRAGDVQRLLPGLADAAAEHVVDQLRVQVIALDEGAQHLRQQLHRMGVGQGTARLAPPRGQTYDIDDHGIGHDIPFPSGTRRLFYRALAEDVPRSTRLHNGFISRTIAKAILVQMDAPDLGRRIDMTGTDPTVHVAVRDDAPHITLDRPATMNAVTASMLGAVADALKAHADSAAVRVAVLTGGGRAFCAVAELDTEALTDPPRPETLDAAKRAVTAIRAFPHPVTGAVNGPGA